MTFQLKRQQFAGHAPRPQGGCATRVYRRRPGPFEGCVVEPVLERREVHPIRLHLPTRPYVRPHDAQGQAAHQPHHVLLQLLRRHAEARRGERGRRHFRSPRVRFQRWRHADMVARVRVAFLYCLLRGYERAARNDRLVRRQHPPPRAEHSDTRSSRE